MTKEECEVETSKAIMEMRRRIDELEEVRTAQANLLNKDIIRITNLEKENAELKAQIEKMKCCQNCKFEDNDCIEEPCSACTRCLGDIKRKGNSDKWEIKENDE